MSYIGIGDIVKIDQSNRLRIPKNVMTLAGIEENSPVIVAVDVECSCIKIYKAERYIREETLKKLVGDKE